MKKYLVLIALLTSLPTMAAQTIDVDGIQVNLCSNGNGLTYCTKADEMNSISILFNYKSVPEYKETKLQKFSQGVQTGTNTINTVGNMARTIDGYFTHFSK